MSSHFSNVSSESGKSLESTRTSVGTTGTSVGATRGSVGTARTADRGRGGSFRTGGTSERSPREISRSASGADRSGGSFDRTEHEICGSKSRADRRSQESDRTRLEAGDKGYVAAPTSASSPSTQTSKKHKTMAKADYIKKKEKKETCVDVREDGLPARSWFSEMGGTRQGIQRDDVNTHALHQLWTAKMLLRCSTPNLKPGLPEWGAADSGELLPLRFRRQHFDLDIPNLAGLLHLWSRLNRNAALPRLLSDLDGR